MELKLCRFADNGNASLGVLFVDGVFECFIVEDEERTKKVYGETRIPEGEYDVNIRDEGGFHQRYKKRYGDMHKGMLCIHNRPDWKLENDGLKFQYILFHTGNTDDHTAGCLLVNDAVSGKTFSGSNSRDAYRDFYPKVVKTIESGECVTIKVEDIEDGK